MILLYPVLLLLFLVLGLWFAHMGGRWAYKKYHDGHGIFVIACEASVS